MFTTLNIHSLRLTMVSRRRGEDLSLYDYAKKYQENQSSCELVKKQNASEDKALSGRLEYLNNQKVLTMKTLQKEINLIKRRSMYCRAASRNVSSHHFDRASLPNTPRRWNIHNFSPAKFVARKALTNKVSRKEKHRIGAVNSNSTKDICEVNPPPLERNEPTLVNHNDIDFVNVAQETNIVTPPAENGASETRECSEKSEQSNALTTNNVLTSRGIFPSNCSLKKENNNSQTTTNILPVWSRHCTQRRNFAKYEKHTPKTAEKSEQWVSGLSVNLNSRHSLSTCQHSDIIDERKFNSILDLGGLKDSRFKNLESVLIPH